MISRERHHRRHDDWTAGSTVCMRVNIVPFRGFNLRATTYDTVEIVVRGTASDDDFSI